MYPLTPLSTSPYALNVSDHAITTRKLANRSVTAEKVEMDYVSNVQIDDKLLSGNGSVLNLQSSSDFHFNYDERTNSVTLHRNNLGTSDKGDDEKGHLTLDVTDGSDNWLGRNSGVLINLLLALLLALITHWLEVARTLLTQRLTIQLLLEARTTLLVKILIMPSSVAVKTTLLKALLITQLFLVVKIM